MRKACILIAGLLTLAGCGSSEERAPAPQRFDEARAFADLEAQVEIGPRPSGSPESKETVRFIAKSLKQSGAKHVRVQEPWANVVAEIPGTEPGAIVVGAHHDTKDIPGFLGANDGASGVAVVLEMARVLAEEAPLDGPSINLVLFDAEEARGDREFSEDGLRGSRQYVGYASEGAQGSPELATIEAMVLFDLVGDCDLTLPREESSDPEIYAAFAEEARDINGSESAAPFGGVAPGVSDDHIPFLEVGIPAADFIDFEYGPGPRPGPYWHTGEDTLDKVCPESLDAIGEAALRALPELP